ncbi:two pore domain potassium channel family protein [Parasedimentitalea maritima]|uniref:Ion transporter n=1 Tax=Parasedimentitalea maritima TaxID=2578117 RepID=A0A5R8ZMG7_9RHOB|nr:potassium channel family protein [Zongyanglinia marina]KAE9627849.1 ion transporter [Zongyanglinia marina]TLP66962.1 two pore domain potassium channel family protein [Zongyanglinia marina]
MVKLKKKLRVLYRGRSHAAVRFRYGLIAFDVVTILFFIATSHIEHGLGLVGLSALVGVVIAVDLAARLWIDPDPWALLKRIYSIADVLVVLSLLLDPFLAGNLAFLRILRLLRLIHSYHLVRDLRRDSRFFSAHEDAVIAAINLFVFVFVTATAVLVFFIDSTSTPTPYIDALYFTVATLTTTGYGDVTLDTAVGKLFSVFIMAVGVALFVRLAQTLFHPQKVKHTCKDCGLMRHDLDAVHCKHCGSLVKIRTLGVE